MKKILINKKMVFIFICAVVLVAVFFVLANNRNNFTQAVIEKKVVPKSVGVVTIGSEDTEEYVIKTAGSVVPYSKVDVVALSQGTVKGIFFEVGDDVFANTILANLYSDSVSTSYSNSQINYLNMKNNSDSIEKIANEAIRQAEIGVANSLEAVQAAEISLETAQDNFNNSLDLQKKTILDTQDKAIISFFSYLNTVDNTLNQINYIVDVEDDGVQIEGLGDVLSAQNPDSLNKAKVFYLSAREKYEELEGSNPDRENIQQYMNNMVELLDVTKSAVDYTIESLDNTVTSMNFTDANLSAQKNSFYSIRANIVSTQSSAETTLSGLENIDLSNKKEVDILKNNIKLAESQLKASRVSYNNALASLEAAKYSKNQQLISAQTSLDSARGQLDLSGTQLSNLVVKAPISGKITGKFIEIGTEISAGQKIAEISQVDKVKIEISLTSEDIYQVKMGQKVNIGNGLEGVIGAINPAADPITKKVGVEIYYDNKNNDLISGTFVDVSIPIESLTILQPGSVYIPLNSIIVTQNEKYVFVVEDNKAKKRNVETGRNQGGYIEITNGLSEGDILIIDGAKLLEEGDEIKIQ